MASAQLRGRGTGRKGAPELHRSAGMKQWVTWPRRVVRCGRASTVHILSACAGMVEPSCLGGLAWHGRWMLHEPRLKMQASFRPPVDAAGPGRSFVREVTGYYGRAPLARLARDVEDDDNNPGAGSGLRAPRPVSLKVSAYLVGYGVIVRGA